MCAKTDTKGCSANNRGVGRHPKKLAVLKELQTCFNAKREKVWERRSHGFPPHYTPAYTIYMWREQAKTYTYIYVTCEFLGTDYFIPSRRWPVDPLQQSLPPPWL